MKKTIIALAIVGALSVGAQRTTRPKLTPIPSTPEQTSSQKEATFTVNPSTDDFRIAGYDKPLRSKRETFFATNYSEGTVGKVTVTITYVDQNGKMLHSRQISVPCEIPTEETRNLSIPSWDQQNSFYFVRSTVPARTQQATPYDVTIEVDSIFFK